MIPRPPKPLKNAAEWAGIVVSIAALLSVVIWFAFWTQGKPSPVPVFEKPPVAQNAIAEDPTAALQGWAGVEAVADLKDWIGQQPKFVCLGPDGVEAPAADPKANVRLWMMNRMVIGKDPDDVPQETGDCTSFGFAHALQATMSGQLFAGGSGEFKRVFPPFQYGAGRVLIWKKQIGGRLPNAGCSGAAVARSAVEYGVLSWDEAEAAGFKYSGALANEWGFKGPPQKALELAARHKVKTVSLLRTVDDIRQAICNGYGVTEASQWGNPQKRYHKSDGRIVAEHTGVWSHQMCIDGYDGSCPSGKRYYHIQNSWPEGTHPEPIDDSPKGGFWVEEADVEKMCAAGDCWAYSDFEGFPSREVNLFSAEHAPPRSTKKPTVKENSSPSKTTISP